MNVNFNINNQVFATEMQDVVDLADGRCSFDLVITCRNADMDLITNKINEIANNVFADFHALIDERVTGFMIFGASAHYHYTIKGTDNQISSFREFIQMPAAQG